MGPHGALLFFAHSDAARARRALAAAAVSRSDGGRWMNRKPRLAALGAAAALAACTATGEAQRPVVTAAVGKVVEGLANETTQRHASDALRALPVVVRSSGAHGAEAVIAEMVRTRLTEGGVAVEVACPAKCFEVTLVEFETEASGQAAAGQLLPVNAGAVTGLGGLPRTPDTRQTLAAGRASALLVTFASRDANRYLQRQQLVAIVAIARSAEGMR
jgi:hypothetical protein